MLPPISAHVHKLPTISAHAHMLSLTPIVTVSPLWSLRMTFFIDGHLGSGHSPAFSLWMWFCLLVFFFALYLSQRAPNERSWVCHSPRYPNSYTTWMSKRPHQPSYCSLRLPSVPCDGLCLHLGRLLMTVVFFTHASSLDVCHLCHLSQPLCRTLPPTCSLALYLVLSCFGPHHLSCLRWHCRVTDIHTMILLPGVTDWETGKS